MKKFLSSIEFYWLPILSGILIGSSYIPFAPWAALFCYAPLFWFWTQKTRNWRQAFWSGFITQFILNFLGFFWIGHTIKTFGGFPEPYGTLASILALLLFCSFAHLFIPLIGIIIFYTKQKGWLKTLTMQNLFIVCLWSLCEIFWPYIFQWHMGYTLLWAKYPIYHFADIIGFQGLSIILLLYNFGFVIIVPGFLEKKVFAKKIIYLLLSFVFLNIFGSLYGYYWQKLPFKTTKILAIQANIGNTERLMAEKGKGYQFYIKDQYVDYSIKGLKQFPDSDIVVWPESAFPEYLDTSYHQRKNQSELITFINSTQKSFVIGAYSRKKNLETNTVKVYNSLFGFDHAKLEWQPPYNKTHLLAYGEYIPFVGIMPWLADLLPVGDGFTPGQGPSTFSVNGINIGPQICYEGLYPYFSRELALQGTDLFINVTNDSWFGEISEPWQHMIMTMARAIENRRPLVRSTNTGITTAIQFTGEIEPQSPLFTPWYQQYTIKLIDNSRVTIYTLYGWLLPYLLILLTLGVFYFDFRISTQKSRLE